MGSGAIIGAAITTGAAIYTAHQQRKIAEEQAANANDLAAQSKAEADKIDGPTGQSTQAQLQASEQRAASAGGTLTGSGGARVGDLSSTPRRSLLGG